MFIEFVLLKTWILHDSKHQEIKNFKQLRYTEISKERALRQHPLGTVHPSTKLKLHQIIKLELLIIARIYQLPTLQSPASQSPLIEALG